MGNSELRQFDDGQAAVADLRCEVDIVACCVCGGDTAASVEDVPRSDGASDRG
jgi:3-phosphoglycerate kinase